MKEAAGSGRAEKRGLEMEMARKVCPPRGDLGRLPQGWKEECRGKELEGSRTSARPKQVDKGEGHQARSEVERDQCQAGLGGTFSF